MQFDSRLNAWVSIDPGMNTGMACWDGNVLVAAYTFRPKEGIEGDSDESVDWIPRALNVVEQAKEIMFHHEPMRIYMENSFFSVGSAKTMVAGLSGSIIQLAMVSGMLIHAALQIEQAQDVQLIKPKVWKGNLPDEILKKRVIEWAAESSQNSQIFQRRPPSIHAYCAIGIGLHVLGKL